MQEKQVLERLQRIGGRAGRQALTLGLTLWYCVTDRDTPQRIRVLLLGDLAYFVSPLDALPDFLPGVGFSDDMGLMMATLAMIAFYVKPEHKQKARETCERWLRAEEGKKKHD